MSSAETLLDAYTRIRERFEKYGKLGMSKNLSERRERELTRLLRDFEVEDLLCAVDGYIHLHGGLDGMIRDKPVRSFFRWQTVFGPESVEDRIELGRERGPWGERRDKPNRAEEKQRAWEAEREALKKQVAKEQAERDAVSQPPPLRLVGEG